jgi:hypothetical protein
MALPEVVRISGVDDHGAARGYGGHGERASRPNIGLQATTSSLRSSVAPASGGA